MLFKRIIQFDAANTQGGNGSGLGLFSKFQWLNLPGW